MERQVVLSRPRGERGVSLFDQFEQVFKQTGKWPEEYEPLDPPLGSEFVWDVFWELRNSSPSGFSGPERLTFLEMDAWQRLRGHKLDNLTIDILLKMDSAYMAEWHKDQKKTAKTPPKKASVNRKM